MLEEEILLLALFFKAIHYSLKLFMIFKSSNCADQKRC